MTIQDTAGNLLTTQTSPMIGFNEVDASDEPLSLRIYPFLIEGIREEDQNNGGRFVERFLEGPQAQWDVMDRRAKDIPKLWSVTEIEDQYLIYLKWIVGWTSELDYITDDLDSATLRRLIAASVPFWKIRGTENAMVDILRLTTGARLRVWNWFDLRWIVGEEGFSDDQSGYDSWMLALPGPPDYDENQMNVRIVDDGTLNRRLVRNLVRLTRPDGETITISYIAFLDQFTVDDDDSQWDHNDVGTTVVADGFMRLDAGQDAVVNVPGADDWLDYVFYARVRGTGLIQFYRTAATDFYFVQIDVAANTVAVGRVLAGVEAILTTIDMFAAHGVTLFDDIFYGFRQEVIPEAGGTRIRVFFDANPIANLIDFTHVQGAIGFASTGLVFDIDQTELFFNPLTEDVIDTNK